MLEVVQGTGLDNWLASSISVPDSTIVSFPCPSCVELGGAVAQKSWCWWYANIRQLVRLRALRCSLGVNHQYHLGFLICTRDMGATRTVS